MTTQASDAIAYLGETFQIAEAAGTGLFDPSTHGLRPVMSSTACYRGFVCRYAVEASRLTLDGLLANHSSDGPPVASRYASGPAINGIASKQTDPRSWERLFNSCYEGLALPLQFTGAMLVGKDYSPSVPVRMGYTPAWKYLQVYELAFVSGTLTAVRDISEIMASVRDKLAASMDAN
ncbi:hypothetical protein [Chitinimonas sp. JJ19]|uniref:hypothetical protein n=1 Tax=Chitinimonas sp. JJ19 TaxID=3109352 RepID=UPI001A529D8F|nr:hypothetical protein [Chitinimonas sp.]